MPSSEYTVNILIKSKDQTSKPAKAAKNSLATLKTAAVLAAKAFVVLKTAQKAIEFVKWGAKIDRAAKSLDAMAKSAGTTGNAIISSIRVASDFQIDRMGAMEAANKAMLMEVASTPEEFEKLATVAVKLGRVMGVDAAGSMDRFVVASARKSIKIADDLGLTISATDANEKYAKANNLLAAELTAAQQSQAFFNEMMEQGERKLATMGNLAATTADKIDTISGAVKTASQVFGEQFADSIGEAMTGTRGFAQTLEDADPAIRAAAATAAAFFDPSQTAEAVRAWQEAGKAFFDLGAGVEKTDIRMERYNTNVERVTKATQTASSANWDYGDSTDDAESGLADLETGLVKVGAAYAAQARKAREAATEMAIANRKFTMEAAADWTSYAKFIAKDAADLAEDRESIEQEHADKLAAIQIQGKATAVAGLLEQEQARYDEEKRLLDESRLEQEIAQKESLGRMVLANFTAWADINKVAQDEIFKTQLFIQEKYGLITEEGAAMALEMTADFQLIKEVGIDAFKLIKAEQDKIARHIAITFSVREAGKQAAIEEHGVAIPGLSTPSYAHGGTTPNRDIMVGELGPERVRLPAGSQVTPASQTTNNYHFEQIVNTRATSHNVMGDFALAEALAS